MTRSQRILKKVSNWYFSKKVLPYWAVLLVDSAIVFACAVFAHWFANNSQIAFDQHKAVFSTAAIYAALSWIGARIFRTYSGVLRFSSFVDLLKVTYANAVTMALAIGVSLLGKWQGWEFISALTIMNTVVTFLLATLLQWGFRISVKLVFDIANSDSQAMPVLIYGALTGGVGLAKNIRSESPARFELKGFITHSNKMKDMRLMGVRVYNLDEDIAAVVRKEGIEGVLVSPLRVEEFRQNQKIQDILIGEGVKIFMTQQAKEASVKNGELSDEEIQDLQIGRAHV